MRGCRVLVVENDPFTLASVVNALAFQQMQVVGQASSAREALALQPEIDAQVALLDLDLGVGPTGIDLAHALRVRQPEIGIVMLSTYRDPRLLEPGMPQPPTGTAYLSKSDVTDFSRIVSQLLASARQPLKTQPPIGRDLPPLTRTQIEVLRCLANGMSTQAIAADRHVSTKAVEQTISRLYEIFDVANDSESNQRVRLARAYYELTGKIAEPEKQ